MNKYFLSFCLLFYSLGAMKEKQSALQSLPMDIQKLIHKQVISSEEFVSKDESSSEFHKSLNQDFKNIQSLLSTCKKYYDHQDLNGIIVQQLSDKYNQNPIVIALRLNAAGSGKWLEKYLKKNLSNMNRAIILFLEAAKEGDLYTFTRLAKLGLHANVSDRQGNTPLMMAIENTDPEKQKEQIKIINWLIKHKAALNTAGPNGNTPLLETARLNNTEAFLLLLAQGANPIMTDSEKNNSLHWALAYKNNDAIEALLQHASIKTIANQRNKWGFTPAQTAGNVGLRHYEHRLKEEYANEQ